MDEDGFEEQGEVEYAGENDNEEEYVPREENLNEDEKRYEDEDDGVTFEYREEERQEEVPEYQTFVREGQTQESGWPKRDGVTEEYKRGGGFNEDPANRSIWTPRTVAPGQIFDVNVGFGQTLRKMPREGWQAERPNTRLHLSTPVGKVRFIQTGTEPCTSTAECIRRCQDIQKYYMDLGFPDIPYNFLIGGDGVVYHGRGWMKQADRSYTYSRLRKTCIDVAYIGNYYENNAIPYTMLAAGADLLKYGIRAMKLSPFFQAYSFLGDQSRRFEDSSKPKIT